MARAWWLPAALAALRLWRRLGGDPRPTTWGAWLARHGFRDEVK